MSFKDCERRADEFREKYNPQNLAPFPYLNVTDENSDLEFFFTALDEERFKTISGATFYDAEERKFTILINSNKPQTRQNFTIGHELGHYLLHREYLVENSAIIDDDKNKKFLFREDDAPRNLIEQEADHFAAALLMPEDLVRDAWNRLSDIQECANVFAVSSIAMNIRLIRLGLIQE